MKVLIVSSSPRKGGNSDVLCDQFAKGAAENGHEVKKICLREKKISPCTACYGCMKTHVCPICDDMPEIFASLLEADIIVFASPVYFYSVAGQIKLLIDRCIVNHTALSNKRFYFIVTAADPQQQSAEGTLMAFRGFLRCLPNAKEEGVIYGMGAWDKGDIYQHPAFEQAYQMGKQI